MKKIFLLSRLFLLTCFASSQDTGGISSLDDLFVGIPLKEGYPKWVEYISAHPFLGFDSANNRGVYSSMKQGIKTHFPFPDSVLVKLLAERQSVVIGGKTLISYTMKIEGVFGKRNGAREVAKDCFRKLKNCYVLIIEILTGNISGKVILPLSRIACSNGDIFPKSILTMW